MRDYYQAWLLLVLRNDFYIIVNFEWLFLIDVVIKHNSIDMVDFMLNNDRLIIFLPFFMSFPS